MDSTASRYLERIGYAGPLEPTLEVLRALHERHLYSVPFENLDIHWKRPIIVETERFLRKILDERRGGFCYELNGAFAWLLGQLGFDVAMLSARVPTADGGLGPPFDHMALRVTIEGRRWLADVGFGDFALHPLSFEGPEIVPGAEEWRVERDGRLEYLFAPEPRILGEFAAMCDYQQYSPASAFTRKRVCTLATEWGRITLTDTRLIITRDATREEIPVSAAEWEDVLRESFGIVRPDGPA